MYTARFSVTSEKCAYNSGRLGELVVIRLPFHSARTQRVCKYQGIAIQQDDMLFDLHLDSG